MYLALWILLLVGLLTVALFAFNIRAPQVEPPDSTTAEPYRATLSGEYVCLPHKDTTGPQTLECAFGLRTEEGKYYGVDLYAMSQEHDPLAVGQHISANGLVTPVERLSSEQWQKYDVVGTFSITDSLVVGDTPDGPYACQADAMVCPDGSAVGRQGPNCEFAPCPTADITPSSVTTHISGSTTVLGVSISPEEIVSDSRCPLGATCIWEGTVEVRTVLATPVAHGEHVLTLGQPIGFGDYTVTLVEVSPEKAEGEIQDSAYRLTFDVAQTR